MKILDANEGVLTNFEVLDFLRSKGAAKDSTRVLAKVTPSEYKTIEDCEERFEDVKELLALVTKTLPPPPNLPNSEEEIIEGKEEIENGEQHKVEPTGEEQNKQGIDDGKEETVAGEQMETS
uniref:DNA-directed RNA polymerase III subunit RPC9 n=1 Tax=Fagus sylvatica TaxID=28930 RepID=A0A2N9ETH1_FAGSY